jgi:hypothetical protein
LSQSIAANSNTAPLETQRDLYTPSDARCASRKTHIVRHRSGLVASSQGVPIRVLNCCLLNCAAFSRIR